MIERMFKGFAINFIPAGKDSFIRECEQRYGFDSGIEYKTITVSHKNQYLPTLISNTYHNMYIIPLPSPTYLPGYITITADKYGIEHIRTYCLDTMRTITCSSY